MSESLYERKCPYCGVPITKNGGTNAITCICGKCFCYYCGEGFETREEVYKHAKAEDHLYNLPPDLAKRQGEEVSEEKLHEFFNKYSRLKDL
ncbi:U3 small nucleolar ribonucleoprotein complex-associated protein, putative [Trichomonas vaginalis G3]|uniref:U3 small nucleolar ribonucleoprotein complex-associated protein, putative n=1 Tax=Trichomonas vaginalis (strain ATCC PRA-98 / G3) TaxID=412133 RepID=A2DKN0_TRIV3|nr:protein polyubiquitination [Trichomonas vaginalis G3]EAY19013.1 U3 small nucleolar ribonucleoprotein complex-associated protein, putative [Trichomonas vaginalis G3]KAI5521194.1 protein polyubiquitination [Trichomonas vaginalis G3]|eukprot:XP_001579999.1 U3 small nucleolar ribonucleoprotein complex-associated protein [Trichomonas vaginalis G3]